jgi:hypothetical protein
LLARGKQPSETGEELGLSVGVLDGDPVGGDEGLFEGHCEGEDIGLSVGVLDGDPVGEDEGLFEGIFEGLFEGEDVGLSVGVLDAVGELEGASDGAGERVGQISALISHLPLPPLAHTSSP